MNLQDAIQRYERLRIEAEALDSRGSLEAAYAAFLDVLRSLDGVEGPDRFMTTDEAAEIHNVHRKTVANWCVEGRFPNAVKTSENGNWRIPASDVYAILGNHSADDHSVEKLWEPECA